MLYRYVKLFTPAVQWMKVTLTIFGGNTLIMQHMLFMSLWMGNVKEWHSLNVFKWFMDITELWIGCSVKWSQPLFFSVKCLKYFGRMVLVNGGRDDKVIQIEHRKSVMGLFNELSWLRERRSVGELSNGRLALSLIDDLRTETLSLFLIVSQAAYWIHISFVYRHYSSLVFQVISAYFWFS